MRANRIAVVGAGIAGLACARELHEAGLDVTVFDKARGAGGRCSTRRRDGRAFDHGAQYFTARDPAFFAWVERFQAEGFVAPWTPRTPAGDEDGDEVRWVGTPGMSALARALGRGLTLRCGTRVALVRPGPAWRIHDEAGADLGRFDAVAIAAPAPQAVALLEAAPALARAAAAAELSPCWATLAGFDAPVRIGFGAARLDDGCLAWVARNDEKPGRPGGESWTLHASAAWSAAHLEDEPRAVATRMLEALAARADRPLPPTGYLDAHRWRHALVIRAVGRAFVWDDDLRIGACGDWCLAPRIEAAWQSGTALAGAIRVALGR